MGIPKSTSKPTASYKNAAVSVTVSTADDKAFAEAIARKLTMPEVSAAGVIEVWQKDTHDVNELVTELTRQTDAVNGGDLTRAGAMLVSQAHALDNIFSNLARRAVNQQYLKQWETYMRMAMKAQNQCRMTLETLATIKNPPTVFARQANINNGGQQQVNNGTAPQGTSRAQEDEPEPNKLLEVTDGKRVDTGTQGPAGRVNQDMATVGALVGAENQER
jgi:hypothetical protein